MATRSKPQAPGSRTVSVKGLVADINTLLRGIDKASATALEKKRAKMLLQSIRSIIEAFCLAQAHRRDLGKLTEFEVGPRGRK
jgi:hypothetical protein